MTDNTLKVENLDLEIAGQKVLQALSMTIRPSEVHILMGPNGAGKSSLAKAIVGHPHYAPQRGHIIFDEQKVDPWTPDKRAQMGIFMAFQSPCEVEGVSVANFLRTAIHAYPHLQASQYTATQFYNHLYTLMDQVGLKRDFAGRELNKGFSGGEKKRLEMLQMLLFQPRLAILDEIDSSLDIEAFQMVVDAIHFLQKNCKTGFLIVTHSILFIEQICPSHIHLLKFGRIVQSGGKELLARIQKFGFNEN
ncbi:MAG: Fe-S cluster assembly ATPase SufC [Puniceicoccales bacterium]|jgi:Fe-S cluster assembly ATP-binding protein|nr:Fe-S cluster assembly ATPase SufC [Puniceicoccales bacterium]